MVQVVPAVPVAGPRNSRKAFQEPADESAACGWLTPPPNIKPLPMPGMLNISPFSVYYDILGVSNFLGWWGLILGGRD